MFELGRMPWRLEICFPSFLQKRSLLMRKTSRIWRAPARGLQRVRMARLLAVVAAVVMVVVLAVVTAVLLAVVTAVVLSEVTSVLLFVATAVVLAVVMAEVMAVVMDEVWLSGVEAKLEDSFDSSFTDDTVAVRLTTMKIVRLTLVTSSELGTVQFVWKAVLFRDVKL